MSLIARRLAVCLLSLLALPSIANSLERPGDSERVLYSVSTESWIPYWIVEGEHISGILSDVMQAINVCLEVPLVTVMPQRLT